MSGIEDGYAMFEETHPKPKELTEERPALGMRPGEGSTYGEALDAERKGSGVEAGRAWFLQRNTPAPRRKDPGQQQAGTPGDGEE